MGPSHRSGLITWCDVFFLVNSNMCLSYMYNAQIVEKKSGFAENLSRVRVICPYVAKLSLKV